jgi:hypothetical protein
LNVQKNEEDNYIEAITNITGILQALQLTKTGINSMWTTLLLQSPDTGIAKSAMKEIMKVGLQCTLLVLINNNSKKLFAAQNNPLVTLHSDT